MASNIKKSNYIFTLSAKGHILGANAIIETNNKQYSLEICKLFSTDIEGQARISSCLRYKYGIDFGSNG